MRPTFMGFETATRGLMSNQKALDIVGNNVTNIGVTGYTRQRADLVSLSVNGRYSRYQAGRTSQAGQGSNVFAVNQLRNAFLDKRFREEYADVGYYGATSAALEDIADSIDEVTPAPMKPTLDKFQTAWNELMGSTINEATGAANLKAVATQLVQVFRQMSQKLDNVWDQQQYGLSLDVENVNSILQRIGQLNDDIVRQHNSILTEGQKKDLPLELMDQRNVLLDQLSEYANIQYEEQADGSVTVWMGGKNDGNPPIVEGIKYEQLAMSVNNDDPQFRTVSVHWESSGKQLNTTSGTLRAVTDMLNGRGLAMDGSQGETMAEGVHYYKDKIDSLARVMVEKFNSVVQVAGDDSLGPIYKSLFAFDNDAYENAAGIRISDEWQADSSYLITNVKDKLEEGNYDNSYAAKALALFNEVQDFGEFQGSFNEYVTFYSTTKLANNTEYAKTRQEAVEATSETLLNQIQQVSGVSMEEEGVDMMQWKKAYDAVSRVFTTLDEMLDKLINGTGVVGR